MSIDAKGGFIQKYWMFHLSHVKLAISIFLVISILSINSEAGSSQVSLGKNSRGAWELVRDGKPFLIQGVGGSGSLQMAKDVGANSIRTWGIEQLEAKDPDGHTLLNRAEELGLTLCVGIWVKHERHGFKYDDAKFIQQQREEIRAAVRKYKDHPSVLVWGLGNEMESYVGTENAVRVWKELNELAKIIKEEDPNHPVMTVIAGADTGKIKEIMKYYPSIDILGINAYLGAGGAGGTLKGMGWTKPFIMTEYGPVGHWQAPKAPWGAAIEPSGNEKAANYFATLSTLIENKEGLCLGSYAFLWGNKQETTSTWYGMLLSTGEKLPPVDALVRGWSGKWPTNRCPKLESIEFPIALKKGKPGEKVKASARVQDADGDALQYEWTVMAESKDLRGGGDAESVPASFPQAVQGAKEKECSLTLPKEKGAYRLFLVVRDGNGAATTGNVPFYVE
jgi:hypothetical protein